MTEQNDDAEIDRLYRTMHRLVDEAFDDIDDRTNGSAPLRAAGEREPGLEVALRKAGGVRALARLVGRTSATVAVWRRIPIEPINHVLTIETRLGIPKEELRPDVYLPPQERSRG